MYNNKEWMKNYLQTSDWSSTACSSDCVLCDGVGRCKACRDQTYLMEGYCTPDCGPGYYANAKIRTCHGKNTLPGSLPARAGCGVSSPVCRHKLLWELQLQKSTSFKHPLNFLTRGVSFWLLQQLVGLLAFILNLCIIVCRTRWT